MSPTHSPLSKATWESNITTIGCPTNPVLALFDKGRMEVILSGHCPECNHALRWCECLSKPSLFE